MRIFTLSANIPLPGFAQKHMIISCGNLQRRFLETSTGKQVESLSKQCYLRYYDGEHLGVVGLVMNRPKAKNAISRQMISEMKEALQRARFDSTIRALILQGITQTDEKGNRSSSFCSGADLKERSTMSQTEVAKFLNDMKTTFREIETLKVPTIAAIDGPALGGGLEMSLCCDFRFAGPTSVLGLPETSLGIIPGAGGTQRLSRLIGASKAKQLIFTALRFGPEQGRSLGIIDTLFQNGSKFGSGDELHSSTGIEQALKLASSIISQAPLAVKMAKQAIDLGITQELVSGLETEQLCYAPLLDTKDRLEGLQAFKEKRKPIYKGI